MTLAWRRWILGFGAIVGIAILAGLAFERFSEAQDASRFPPPGRLVDVGGGQRLHLLCSGPTGGPTVIMVAGGGTPAVASYRLQMEIARTAHVCSYDRPGLGWSSAAPRAMTFQQHVDQLDALLRNAHIPGPYLFAPESFGSLIAIGYARQHPQDTAGIVFIDGVDPQLWFSAVEPESGWDADAKNALFQLAWRIGLVRLAFPALAPRWVNDLPSSLRAEFRAIYSRPAPGWDEAIQAYRRSPPGGRPILTPGMLGSRPVIAVQHGKASSELSSVFQTGWAASQQRLAGASHIGRLLIAQGAHHQVAQEAPIFAAQAVNDALRELSPRSMAIAHAKRRGRRSSGIRDHGAL
jgi:pimeloyl-ACP methyl ester carboxylesterase